MANQRCPQIKDKEKGIMGKLRGQATLTSNDHRAGRGGGGRYQQVDMTMTPPPANRLLNHHGSLSSADSSILYNTRYYRLESSIFVNFRGDWL